MLPCRLIVDEPAQGAWNMAVDETLLESASSGEICTLRFYGWNEPTLSLGYFQKHADRGQHRASLSCPWVRRMSGGGAILHDDELTYSFAAPATLRESAQAALLYDAFHQSLIEVLSAKDIQARQWHIPVERAPEDEPFLCFQRRAAGDVVLNGSRTDVFKIAGSAQRRRRGAILQHGSVLFRASKAAPELPGLEQITGLADFSRQDLVERWAKLLGTKIEIGLCAAHLSPQEMEQARMLENDKYNSASWNERK